MSNNDFEPENFHVTYSDINSEIETTSDNNTSYIENKINEVIGNNNEDNYLPVNVDYNLTNNQEMPDNTKAIPHNTKARPHNKTATSETTEKDIPDINIQKYGDDSIFESWCDLHIFYPIADKLIDPLRKMGLTPNQVTYLSTFCTLLSVYYVSIKEYKYAACAYFIGYLLDCVDGRMARKYNMTSSYGMMIDLVTDNVTNLILILYLSYEFGFLHWAILFTILKTYLLSIGYGLNEAIYSFKATGSDNFHLRRKEQLKETPGLLKDTFLLINQLSYQNYKTVFPNFTNETAHKWLPIVKEFGPGNYAAGVIFTLLFL